jgi:hypothetical protein
MYITINTKVTNEQLEKEKEVLSPKQRENVIKQLENDKNISLNVFTNAVTNDKECVNACIKKEQPSIGLKECSLELFKDKEFVKGYIQKCLENKSDLSDIVLKPMNDEYETLYKIKNINVIKPLYCVSKTNPKTNEIDDVVVIGSTFDYISLPLKQEQ